MPKDEYITFSEVNRAVVTIKAKQPFLDWLESLPERAPGETFSLDRINEDNTAFLVPAYGDNEKIRKYVASIAPAIFEEQLEGWYTEEAFWPKNRNLKMFWEWFDVEIHSVTIDASPIPLEKEDT